ncbi:MAG: amino acid transporter [Verrucomicrobia bacterium]|nr:MAG: amino acid transporter [Verrucomicrobiota bacterium]
MDSIGVHRPRNVDWKRAAALLYGDWGTSKAYVIGAAFLATGYSSLPIILAVCALTGVVGYNYITICRHFPDGGGVYSAARSQSRLLAVIGALMLVADLTVTAALSGWSAMTYFHIPKSHLLLATVGLILGVGAINHFGPKHTGSLAVTLALPTVIVVVLICALSLPHLTLSNLKPTPESFAHNWKAFVGVILALSGVESIANLTGVMKLDSGSTMEAPQVGKTATKSIWIVALEVVLGTALLGWAMLSLPSAVSGELHQRWEDMLNVLAEQYGQFAFGPVFGKSFGIVTGVIVGMLLLSAVNTAVGALIGLFYLMARDGEMPRPFTRLNSHGVPLVPLALASLLPLMVVIFSPDTKSLMELYAIGVVGAITVNLGSCLLNKKLKLKLTEFIPMVVTFLVLFAIEITLAKTKPNALFFIVCILIGGLSLRAWAQKRAGLRTVTLTEQVAATVVPDSISDFRVNLNPGQSILVAARGLTPVLRFALEEASLRQGSVYVLYVKEVAVSLPGALPGTEPVRWQDDRHASEIMYGVLELGRQNNVPVIPLYAVSDNPAGTILDLAATLGVDMLVLGTSHHRRTLASLLKGNVVNEVAKNLPENIRLVIYG